MNKKLKTLFKKGRYKIENELNIDKILNNMRELKSVMKSHTVDRSKFAHNHKNFISID